MIMLTNDSNLNDLEINQTNNTLIDDNSITSDTEGQPSNTTEHKLDPNNFELIIESEIQINLSDLQLDKSIQSREKINIKKVNEYSELIKEGFEFHTLISVIRDETEIDKFILIDGFHRLEAYKNNSKEIIKCNLMKANYKDESKNNIEIIDSKYVSLFSILTNRYNGLQRTNADKRKGIKLVVTHPDFENCSVSKISKVCAVDRGTVNSVIDELIKQGILRNHKMDEDRTVSVERNGKIYSMKLRRVEDNTESKKLTPEIKEHSQAMEMETSIPSIQFPEIEEDLINSNVELLADDICTIEKEEQNQHEYENEVLSLLDFVIESISLSAEFTSRNTFKLTRPIEFYNRLEQVVNNIDTLNKNLSNKSCDAASCVKVEIKPLT